MAEGNAFVLGVLVGVAGLWLAHIAGYAFPQRNTVPIFSPKSGLPVNCRALIQVGLESYHSGEYTADATLNSIERNCGPRGIIWDE